MGDVIGLTVLVSIVIVKCFDKFYPFNCCTTLQIKYSIIRFTCFSVYSHCLVQTLYWG